MKQRKCPLGSLLWSGACSHWAWAISSGISHRSNMHEWEITTEWGAITSPESVRVRWHYLASWEPLLSRGSVAPKRVRATLLLWGEQTIWSLPATWGHLSGDKGPQMFQTCEAPSATGFICVQPSISITVRIQWRKKATVVGTARDDNLDQTVQRDKNAFVLSLTCRAGGHRPCVLCNYVFSGRVNNIWGREEV